MLSSEEGSEFDALRTISSMRALRHHIIKSTLISPLHSSIFLPLFYHSHSICKLGSKSNRIKVGPIHLIVISELSDCFQGIMHWRPPSHTTYGLIDHNIRIIHRFNVFLKEVVPQLRVIGSSIIIIAFYTLMIKVRKLSTVVWCIRFILWYRVKRFRD